MVVFSTSVEVFLQAASVVCRCIGLLHVRGGVSIERKRRRICGLSSPRPWRCFQMTTWIVFGCVVFSTSVEVFPVLSKSKSNSSGLLHVRGGVSSDAPMADHAYKSSPRPWRCFLKVVLPSPAPWVFSTSVEVFLSGASSVPERVGLLHVRGGVSKDAIDALTELGLLHVRGGVSSNVQLTVTDRESSPRPWRCFR